MVKLTENGRATLTELSKDTGLTAMAVKKRLDKLLNQDVIRVSCELNVEKLNFYLLLSFLQAEGGKALEEIRKRFSECPRLIWLMQVFGEYNVATLSFVEDEKTFKCIVAYGCGCALANIPGVRRVTTLEMVTTTLSYFPLRLNLIRRGLDKAPCGCACSECEAYKYLGCSACPAVSVYRGPL